MDPVTLCYAINFGKASPTFLWSNLSKHILPHQSKLSAISIVCHSVCIAWPYPRCPCLHFVMHLGLVHYLWLLGAHTHQHAIFYYSTMVLHFKYLKVCLYIKEILHVHQCQNFMLLVFTYFSLFITQNMLLKSPYFKRYSRVKLTAVKLRVMYHPNQ